MVNTRLQVHRKNRNGQTDVDRFTDDDDNVSVADHYQESYFNENENQKLT